MKTSVPWKEQKTVAAMTQANLPVHPLTRDLGEALLCRLRFFELAAKGLGIDGPPGSPRRAFLWADERCWRDHPGFYPQIIILALPCYFLLMRSEIVHALLDLVTLRCCPDDRLNGGGGLDRFRCLGERLLGYPHCSGRVWNRLPPDVPCKRRRALYQRVEILPPVHHTPPLSGKFSKRRAGRQASLAGVRGHGSRFGGSLPSRGTTAPTPIAQPGWLLDRLGLGQPEKELSAAGTLLNARTLLPEMVNSGRVR